ncbi:cytochrome P450 [Aspergillus egyptiacus]|nr:cytochrome P450 [Aspergillus egyptiacus]
MASSNYATGHDLIFGFNGIQVLKGHLRLQDLVTGTVVATLVYWLALIIYRLYFSPLAGFPEPKIAAATEWYEFYFQLVKDGQWGNQVKRLHEEYGPIVRITPWELSIRDLDFYHELYVASSTRRTDSWARGREGNGFDGKSYSHHLSVSHDLHRQRRKHLETFFSKQNITRFEDIIVNKIQLLEDQLWRLKGTKSVVSVNDAFTALTGDIIGHVACGAHPGLVDDANFSPEWHDLMTKTVLVAPLFRCSSWLNRLIQCLPSSVLQRLYPEGISNMMVGKMGKEYIERTKNRIQQKKDSDANSPKLSVFHHLLTSNIPESEKSTSRLQAEAMVILIAGTFTSAHTLSMIVYHALSDPSVEKRLREDLKDIMSCYPTQNPRLADLEKIPYLQACIKEALRLYGLIGNLPRCSPDVELQFKQWTIPRSTPVGMSIHYMHTHPDVWPEPLKFVPERWLGNCNRQMDRNFVPFTKGSRSCIGMNLAMAELYLTIAILFRPNGPKLSLFETDESDVEFVRDFVMGFPKQGSRGVRVTVE